MCACALVLLAALLAALPVLGGPLVVAGPSFAVLQQRSLVARVGDHAALRCRVLGLADRAVSWVRSSDLQILSHAGAVFTADSRVSCSEAPYTPELQDPDNSSGDFVYGAGILTSRDDAFNTTGTVHTLKIERLRVIDSGRYECQINTEPKLSLFFNLTVVESSFPTVVVRAVGTSAGGVVWGAEGSAARFVCEAHYEPAGGAPLDAHVQAALPALRVTWLHEGELVDPRSSRGGISLDTERWAGRVVSTLTLARTASGDAGRYTCGAGEGQGEGEGEYHTADVLLRLRDDQRDHEPDQGEPEWMQRDQAVARVSSGVAGGAGGAGVAGGGGWRGAGAARAALGPALLLLFLT